MLCRDKKNLLYLISTYLDELKEQKNPWMKKIALQVFIFEGIVRKAFSWDYSPVFLEISKDRLFFNVSQEAERDIRFLANNGFLRNLKLTTSEYDHTICFRTTKEAARAAVNIDSKDRVIIDQLLHCPICKYLWDVQKHGYHFIFSCSNPQCSHRCKSNVTTLEDVSYFCIPYFFNRLTPFEYCPPKDLQAKLELYIAQSPRHNIVGSLEHKVFLTKTKVVIGEWLPFGHNQVATLGYKINSPYVEQNIKFLHQDIASQNQSVVEVPHPLVSIKVYDSDLKSYVDFAAHSKLPEDPEINQVEKFAVHINYTGQVRYALDVLAINNMPQNNIIMDYLPRLLFDVEQSSTVIMNTLLTAYQKKLLDVLFYEKFDNRNKYDFIIAEDIFFDDKEHTFEEKLNILQRDNSCKSEISQITNNIQKIFILDDKNSTLVVGNKGAIFIGHHEKYEFFIADFVFLMSVEVFLEQFFTRLFLLKDDLEQARRLSNFCERNPQELGELQQTISKLRNDAILLEEIWLHLENSVSEFRKKIHKVMVKDTTGVYQKFNFAKKVDILHIRIKELQKTIAGTQKHLEGLSNIADVVNEKQLRHLQESLSRNTKSLEEVTKTNERSNMSLKVLEVIMAGGIAFSIMNQLTGEWHISEGNSFRLLLQKIFDVPGGWLLITLMFWFTMVVVLFWYIKRVQQANSRVLSTQITLNCKYSRKALQKLIVDHKIQIFSSEHDGEKRVVCLSWEDIDDLYWLGNKAKIDICYDKHKLIYVALEITSYNNKISHRKAESLILNKLKKWEVVREDDILQLSS